MTTAWFTSCVPRLISDELAVPVLRGLLGAIDVDGGATDEQLALLEAIVKHDLHLEGLELSNLTPLSPADTARQLGNDPAVRRFHLFLMFLEQCRHPLSKAQVERVDEYARALSLSGSGLDLTRTMVNDGMDRAKEDFKRFERDLEIDQREVTLRDRILLADKTDPDLAKLLLSFENLAEGTLGHELLDFYHRNRLGVPGLTPATVNYVFVAHDMNHVIAGYEATAEGEMALGAFQMGLADTDANWMLCIANLAIHETGLVHFHHKEPEIGVMARPGVSDLWASALDRGTRSGVDFTTIDHLALADHPLDEVRERLQVAPHN